ncbi:MAG: LysR family transcriptional regulator [Coriobacteriales bacterium]|jgi:LysR family cyn operon transcriptional activator
METERLKQLVSIARLGSLSAAADEMGYTQPTLSRSMKKLETELGCELFERTKNSMELNEAGKIVLDYAEEILRSEHNLKREIDDLNGREKSFRIGTCAPAPLWKLTEALVNTRPGIMVGPKMMSQDQVERAIFNNDVDIAISLRPINLPSYECFPFMEESLLLYVREDNPLSKRKEVSFKDIDGNQFLIFSDIGFWWEICKECLPNSHFIRQSDRVVFTEVSRTSNALMFATVLASYTKIEGRVTVPITDEKAHATYYMLMSSKVEEDLIAGVRAAASI